MKYPLMIAGLVILSLSLPGCADTEPRIARQTANTDHKIVAETSNAPPRTPLPANIRKDGEGNLINPDGWPIQEIITKEAKRRSEIGKNKSGRRIIYSVLLITPEGHPVSEAASPVEDYYEWRINSVSELSGRDGKVFCYEYGASLFTRNGNENSGMATGTSYRLCDYDGDGKYEFNGGGFKFSIPDWVKSLPGDSGAVNSDANW